MRENKISSFHGLLTVKKALEEDGDAGAIATFAPFYGAEVTLAENGYEVLI
jgi:hypothetical protein